VMPSPPTTTAVNANSAPSPPPPSSFGTFGGTTPGSSGVPTSPAG
jgi:hypothetical protein